MKSACQAKLKDLKLALQYTFKHKKHQEKDLLERMNGKSYSVRKMIRKLRVEIYKERKLLKAQYWKKIDHYANKQIKSGSGIDGQNAVNSSRIIPTVTPRYLEEYSTLSIFGLPESLSKREKPLGPYVCGGNIKLNKNEKNLLSKDPKFSVIYEPDMLQVSTETERMNCKHRYNEFSKKRKKKSLGSQLTTPDGRTISEIQNNNKKNDDGRSCDNADKLYEIFLDNRSSHVYNPLSKTVDFTKRKPSDYKHNKHVNAASDGNI